MLRIRRYYNQNKKVIWRITGFIVFFILLIQLLNYFAKNKNMNNDMSGNTSNNISFINNSNYTDLYVSSDKSVLSNEKMTSSNSSELETINKFFSYCNGGQIQNAYALLTDECKKQMYPKIKNFQESYYKRIFNNGKAEISVENWIDNIYKVKFGKDILSTGVYNKDDIRTDYITVEEIENSEKKLNINGYIKSVEINKTGNQYKGIEVKVQKKEVYMDYEIYTLEIKNNRDNSILMDNLVDINSMYLKDSNDIKYPAYTHELSQSQLLIGSNENRIIKIKYYDKYESQRNIKSLNFSKLILDYDSYINLKHKNLFNNYHEISVDY